MQLPLFVGVSTLLFTTSFTAATAVPTGYQTQTEDGNRWVNLTSLPSPRQEHTAVAVDNNTIAVLGGIERIGNDVRINQIIVNVQHFTRDSLSIHPLTCVAPI